MWSESHGPDNVQEPLLFDLGITEWRRTMIEKVEGQARPWTNPILCQVTSNQRVFNGYGVQEATDMLALARIHPDMPTYYVCKHPDLFARFKRNVVSYQTSRIQLMDTPGFPLISGPFPFHFNAKAHEKFCLTLVSMRRSTLRMDQDALDEMHSMNLLNPNAVIQPDGKAIGESLLVYSVFSSNFLLLVPPDALALLPLGPLRPHKNNKTIHITNWKVSFLRAANGAKFQTGYTPISARPPTIEEDPRWNWIQVFSPFAYRYLLSADLYNIVLRACQCV